MCNIISMKKYTFTMWIKMGNRWNEYICDINQTRAFIVEVKIEIKVPFEKATNFCRNECLCYAWGAQRFVYVSRNHYFGEAVFEPFSLFSHIWREVVQGMVRSRRTSKTKEQRREINCQWQHESSPTATQSCSFSLIYVTCCRKI